MLCGTGRAGSLEDRLNHAAGRLRQLSAALWALEGYDPHQPGTRAVWTEIQATLRTIGAAQEGAP